MRRGRHAAGVVTLLCALLCLLVLPAAAERPYPPSPPPEPPASEVEASCEIDDAPDLTCEGQGYLPDSTVTIEVRRAGPDTVVAALEVQVGADGTFRAHDELPCDVAGATVVVTITGRDGQDRPTVETRTIEVPPAPDCDPSDPNRAGVAGEEVVQGAPDGGDDDGPLAFTGRNLLILAAIALLVLLLGAALVRARGKRGDGPA